MSRKLNFAAGPSMLPLSVLEEVQKAVIDFEGLGYSILETNHRSPVFDRIRAELKEKIRSLMSVPDDYDILFCPGGGRLQFSMVPLNLVTETGVGGYIVTGKWSDLAMKECARLTRAQVLWKGNGRELPREPIAVGAEVDYVYFCDNETVDGTEFPFLPRVTQPKAVYVADMSSNFMSRPIRVADYGVIWAGMQKNFGISGLSVLIVRHQLLHDKRTPIPLMLDWQRYFQTDSVPNSVPVLQFYVALLMARWIEKEGGLVEMDRWAREKSTCIYETIEAFPSLYRCDIPKEYRSRMNVVFSLRDERLTESFIREAAAEGMLNVAGHASRGGLRISLYNAMPREAVEKLSVFMRTFAGRHSG
ncbi:Aminotransferase, class V/Cysteine desulfurase [gut metagenome]|uniref:phosphoserine transaminase n=1 Tax=gut metagenome TaxID=749906 RepID=J9FVR3_9ZZZZ